MFTHTLLAQDIGDRFEDRALACARDALDRDDAVVLEDQTGDVVIASEDLFVCQREQRAPTPLTGFDLKLALGGGSDDQVL